MIFRNFRTAIEHELHMVSHAYVTYLKKIRFEKEDSTSSTLSRNTQNNSAGLKMARYLVRTSIKRLLPKKTLDTITTPKHLDGELEKHIKWKCLFYPSLFNMYFEVHRSDLKSNSLKISSAMCYILLLVQFTYGLVNSRWVSLSDFLTPEPNVGKNTYFANE